MHSTLVTGRKFKALTSLPAFLIAFAALLLSSCGGGPAENAVQEQEALPHSYIYNAARVGDDLHPEATRMRVEKDAALAVQTRYPANTFENSTACYQVRTAAPLTGNAIVDEALERWVTGMRNSYIREFNDTCDSALPPAKLLQTFENSFTGGNAISVLMFTSVYTGGAHPMTGLTSMSFDMRNGKKLEYSDIFADAATNMDGLLELLSDYARKALRPNLGQFWEDGDMFTDGLKPVPANFSNFALVPDGLVIIFPAYQAGPYSAGIQSFLVPLSELVKFRPLPGIWQ